MTKAQNQVVAKLSEHPSNRIIEIADHLTKRVRYALQFWENGETDYIFPNPRTVRSLLDKEILIRNNGSDILILAKQGAV